MFARVYFQGTLGGKKFSTQIEVCSVSISIIIGVSNMWNFEVQLAVPRAWGVGNIWVLLSDALLGESRAEDGILQTSTPKAFPMAGGAHTRASEDAHYTQTQCTQWEYFQVNNAYDWAAKHQKKRGGGRNPPRVNPIPHKARNDLSCQGIIKIQPFQRLQLQPYTLWHAGAYFRVDLCRIARYLSRSQSSRAACMGLLCPPHHKRNRTLTIISNCVLIIAPLKETSTRLLCYCVY